MYLLLVVATWQGIVDWRARAGRAEGFWLAGIFTLAFGYAAGHIPFLKQLQPYRFVVSGDLFLLIPCYLGLGRLLATFRDASAQARLAIAIVAMAFAFSLFGNVWDLFVRTPARGLGAEASECVRWILDNGEGGRILCEPSNLGCLLPHLTGREVIGGGVSSQTVVVQGWTHVDRNRAFGRPLNSISSGDFLVVCRQLDLRTFIVESAELESAIRGMPTEVKKMAEIGRFRIYCIGVGSAPEIWEGCYDGRLRVTHNRIRIENPPVGNFAINYHYLKGFPLRVASISSLSHCQQRSRLLSESPLQRSFPISN